MAKNDKVAALRKLPLFADLSEREVNGILRQMREEYFNAGDDIVTEGEGGGPLHLILEGRVKAIVNGRARRSMGPGEVVGEIALIDQGPRSATIRAETHVRALTITSWNFLALLEDNWKLTHKVMKGLCRRIRELDKEI